MQILLMTSRLRLVPLRKTDLDRLLTLLSEPGVCRYLCDGEILPPDAVVTLIDRSLELASTVCAGEKVGHRSGGAVPLRAA